MSCYLRHLKPVMSRAGVEPGSKEERKAVDLAIRDMVGIKGGRCPEVWKEVKEWLKDPVKEEQLIKGLSALKPMLADKK